MSDYEHNHVVETRVGASPILKYVGGKRQLLPELTRRMPATFGRYFEPFVGGAALFLHLGPERATLGDSNADLIDLYRTVASDVEGVISQLEQLRAGHGKQQYYAARALWNESRAELSAAERAAILIYLNKTCFNGLWRVNRAGHFNVPMGDYKNPKICDPGGLRAAAAALARAELIAGDYRRAVASAAPGDFVYFDPPYVPASETANFTSYTSDGFGLEQQRELAETARALVARGCRVMLSNSDVPIVRELYAGFRIDGVQCARAINSDASRRGPVGEVIAMGGY